jgi:hypothetical protein
MAPLTRRASPAAALLLALAALAARAAAQCSSPGASQYDNGGTCADCTVCSAVHKLETSACQANSDPTANAVCGNCATGYTANGDGDCVANCVDGTSYGTSGYSPCSACTSCSAAHKVQTSACTASANAVCGACVEGFSLANGVCVANCEAGQGRNSEGTCSACTAGSTWSDGTAPCSECTVCSASPNRVAATASRCTASADVTCTCTRGYALSDDGACVAAPVVAVTTTLSGIDDSVIVSGTLSAAAVTALTTAFTAAAQASDAGATVQVGRVIRTDTNVVVYTNPAFADSYFSRRLGSTGHGRALAAVNLKVDTVVTLANDAAAATFGAAIGASSGATSFSSALSTALATSGGSAFATVTAAAPVVLSTTPAAPAAAASSGLSTGAIIGLAVGLGGGGLLVLLGAYFFFCKAAAPKDGGLTIRAPQSPKSPKVAPAPQ